MSEQLAAGGKIYTVKADVQPWFYSVNHRYQLSRCRELSEEEGLTALETEFRLAYDQPD